MQAQGRSHNNSPVATNATASISNRQHRMVTAGSSHGQDKDMEDADSNQCNDDNVDVLLLKSFISPMLGFAGFGFAAFLLTVNWYLNDKGK
jgi:hypothetical protein